MTPWTLARLFVLVATLLMVGLLIGCNLHPTPHLRAALIGSMVLLAASLAVIAIAPLPQER